MHVEDMHTRRSLRMMLLRFGEGTPVDLPDELELKVREQNGETWLLEHRGELSPLMAWLSTQDVEEIAIGTEDLKSLYDQFHGAAAAKDEDEVPV
jgi:ABC-2 type transport system ATP-binding protein